MKTLGIDVGIGGTRAVVIDRHGNVVASATTIKKDRDLIRTFGSGPNRSRTFSF